MGDAVRRTLPLGILIAFALGLLAGPAIAGTIFSVPLPELVGVMDFPASKTASFDFGVPFAEIESVSIEVEAHVFAQEFDDCGLIFDSQPCVHMARLLGFFARLDEQDHPVFGTISSASLDFSDDLKVPEGSRTSVAPFRNFVLPGWDFLLDGEGSLRLFWNRLLSVPNRDLRNFTDPSGEIFSARLIIEGTPVPEPSTALLLATGLLGLAGQSSRWRARNGRHLHRVRGGTRRD